jgi:hypothetical protein
MCSTGDGPRAVSRTSPLHAQEFLTAHCPRHVRLWPKADINFRRLNVRYWGKAEIANL